MDRTEALKDQPYHIFSTDSTSFEPNPTVVMFSENCDNNGYTVQFKFVLNYISQGHIFPTESTSSKLYSTVLFSFVTRRYSNYGRKTISFFSVSIMTRCKTI